MLAGPFTAVAASGTLIRGAQIYDGTGWRSFQADVRIRDGRITAIGSLERMPDDRVVNAYGLILSPGFIDTHSHHDFGAFEAPDMLAAVSQGITTIVVGADGGSAHPLKDYFARLEANPLAVNVASYVGHNTVRARVLGDDFQRPASAAEIDAMAALVAEDMAAGALGLSTGLEYDPGIYSETAEVIALAEVAAAAGGRYASHLRSEDRFFWEALDELLRIGEATGMPVHVSHIKLAAKSLWGDAVEVRQRLTAARARGIEVSADIYPYEYWSSTMAVLLPERDFEDRTAIEFALAELAPPESIYLVRYLPEPALVGRSVREIANDRGQDAATAYSRLLLDAVAFEAESGVASAEAIVATSMTEPDIATLMNWTHTNICSDGAAEGHPRGWGAYPRVLAHYVRERQYLSLPRAIRKMTSLAAENVGLKGRGTVSVGAPADLVLFNPDTVRDRATLETGNAPASGIIAVWTNGSLVYRNGSTTGARPGQVLRRPLPAAAVQNGGG